MLRGDGGIGHLPLGKGVAEGIVNHQDEPTVFLGSNGLGILRPGLVLNGIYRIEQHIGSGGMGEVYLAVSILSSGQRAAIKVISPKLADDPVVEKYFLREADALYRIQSPAVAQFRLITRDTHLGLLYIASEYVEGPTLARLMKKGPATAEQLTTLMLRVATGLKAAHAADCIHRDLSPDNILLPHGDPAQAKIIDFGISKDLTLSSATIGPGTMKGRLSFMAPEQFENDAGTIGPWTDVYGLALTALAFAMGKAAEFGVTLGSAIAARQQPIDLTPVPPALQPLFAAMLTYDWRYRMPTMDAVIAALSEPPPKPPPPPKQATGTWSLTAIASGAAFAVAAAVLSGVTAGRWTTGTHVPLKPPPPPPPVIPGRARPTPPIEPLVQTTASGLRYQVLVPGSSTDHPGPDDTVKVIYSALRSDGAPFGEARKPMRLAMARLGPGLREGLRLMTRNARYRIDVPDRLVRADHRTQGSLTFEVTLLDFEAPLARQPAQRTFNQETHTNEPPV